MSQEQKPLCNLCGLSCVIGPSESPASGPHGLIEATVTGGYESTPGNGCGALDDMVRHSFSLCEFCLDWLFSKFNVPVAVDDPMNDYLLKDKETLEEGMQRMGMVQIMERPQPPPWKPAAQRVAEDKWRTGKAEFLDEKVRRDAARFVK